MVEALQAVKIISEILCTLSVKIVAVSSFNALDQCKKYGALTISDLKLETVGCREACLQVVKSHKSPTG